MPAELPSFWQGDRRAFLRDGVEIVKKAGIIYSAIELAPLLAACTDVDGTTDASVKEERTEELFIPERSFSLEWVKWKKESDSGIQLKELEDGTYLFGQFGKINQRGVLTIFDLLTGQKLETRLPISNPTSLKFSPDLTRISVWSSSPNLKDGAVFLVDIDGQKLFPRKVAGGISSPTPEGVINWSPDSRFFTLTTGFLEGGGGAVAGNVRIFDRNGNLIREQPRALAISFSPNGEWLVWETGQFRLQAFNLTNHKIVTIPPSYPFPTWSPDGKSMVLDTCTTPTRELTCAGVSPTVLNLETGRGKVFDLPQSQIFKFSPGGGKLFLAGENNVNLIDLATNNSKTVFKLETEVVIKDAVFSSEDEVSIAFYRIDDKGGGFNALEVIRLNLVEGRVLDKVLINLKGTNVVFDKFLKSQWLRLIDFGEFSGPRPPPRKFLIVSLATGKSHILGEAGQDEYADFIPQIITDGDLVSARGHKFIFQEKRLYPISLPVEQFLVDVSPVPIPSSTITEIPQSENKIEFDNGELLVGDDGSSWYLRNKTRYRVNEAVDDFVQRRYKNMKAWEVPFWVIDKVSRNEYPPQFFKDQYLRTIDGYSPRLIVLMAGVNSVSEDAITTFTSLVGHLKSIGWVDNQILYGSYNVDTRKTDDGIEITPQFYDQRHSKQLVNYSVQAFSYFLDWIRRKAPLSQVTICGHSQGGDIGFSGALSHPDLTCQIITIDSPLKGVDQMFLKAQDIDLDKVGNFWGDAARSYIEIGDDQSFSEIIEKQVLNLQNRGIEVFSFSNSYDGLVRPDRAVLLNSNKKIGEESITLLWDEPDWGLLGSHGALLHHYPFLNELLKVIGRP